MAPTGDLTIDDVKPISEQTSILTTKVKDEGKKSLILVDLSGVRSVAPLALGLSVAAVKDIEFDKISCFGANNIVTGFLNSVITAAGERGQIKLFPNKSEAVAWLRESR